MLLGETSSSLMLLDNPPLPAEVRAMAEVITMKVTRPPGQVQDAAVKTSVLQHKLRQ